MKRNITFILASFVGYCRADQNADCIANCDSTAQKCNILLGKDGCYKWKLDCRNTCGDTYNSDCLDMCYSEDKIRT